MQKSTRAGSRTATGPFSDQPSRGELAGPQQEPHAVHGPLLQLCHDLPPAKERTGSPGLGHRHAKRQALPQGTRQEADRTWQVRILLPGSSVCHRLEDRKPIHFLSNYHDQRRASTVNRREGDRSFSSWPRTTPTLSWIPTNPTPVPATAFAHSTYL